MTEFSQACMAANQEVMLSLGECFTPALLEKGTQGAGGDISSGADMLAEEIFVRHLSPFGSIESEESGVIGEGRATLIIDPLDGSANYASGFPYYGTSVALLDSEGKLRAAQICNLATGEIFVKELYEELAMHRLPSEEHEGSTAVRDSAPELGLFEKAYANPLVAASLLEAGYKFRSPGATALSLAYAHSVQFFLFVGESRIYDIAAGLAICEGLEVIVEEDYVIVSQDKNIGHDIEMIIRRSLV